MLYLRGTELIDSKSRRKLFLFLRLHRGAIKSLVANLTTWSDENGHRTEAFLPETRKWYRRANTGEVAD